MGDSKKEALGAQDIISSGASFSGWLYKEENGFLTKKCILPNKLN